MGYFDQLSSIKDYKKLLPPQLEVLASDLRSQLIHEQAKNPFLGSNLGVVELSLALHYVFHNARDKVLWDIGHQKQAYNLLAQKLNIYSDDPLATTKPGCVISRAVGYTISRDMRHETGDIISVIGDISLSSGQAFEAMNHAGSLASKMIVI
ncbi:MAG: 1-deoxy-D-xylulose-5-phosphate synthase N-terminal domain-containing protein, partial [Alphaproteobacteria bacterium]|nr:1-deoxy-D-xylulose-5-phosphate synthase N-terminal domain-containing protein [Alphaproteobacteria bacterium]